MALELVADCGSDEVGTVGVEFFRHQEVDVAQVDITQVDRDLLRVACLRAQLMNITGHRGSPKHPSGWYMDGSGRMFKGQATYGTSLFANGVPNPRGAVPQPQRRP